MMADVAYLEERNKIVLQQVESYVEKERTEIRKMILDSAKVQTLKKGMNC